MTPPPQFQGTGQNSTNRNWTDGEVVERHKELLSLPSELRHLTDVRGLTLDSICRFKIGLYEPGIYMIPVFDDVGGLMAVRYYRASDHKKWGVKDVSTKMLYPLLGMNGANPLWFCEGEFDAMIGIQNGLHIITTTAGATATPATLEIEKNMNYFGPHRRFVLAFDNDLAGHVATAMLGLKTLRGKIDGVVMWPHDFEKDISDWFGTAHDTAGLEALVEPFDQEWALHRIEEGCRVNTDKGKRAPKPLADILEMYTKPSLLVGAPADAGDAWEAPVAVTATAETLPEPDTHAVIALTHEAPFPIDAWPTNGFLGAYWEYSHHLAPFLPPQFVAGTAFCVYSTAIGRRAYTVKGSKNMYANTYSLLIGNSGCGKTTSINVGTRVLKLFDDDLFMPEVVSSEKLIDLLVARSDGIFVFSEGQSFIDLFEKAYGQAMYGMLLKLFDCDTVSKSFMRDKGKVRVEDPHICFLSGCVPDVFENGKIQEKDVTSGFIPRMSMWIADDRRNVTEEEHDYDTIQDQIIVAKLRKSVEFCGRMTASQEAKVRMMAWAAEWTGKIGKNDQKFGSCFSRMLGYLRKFSMMFQINDAAGLTISLENVERAIKICDWLLFRVEKLVGGVTNNKHIQNSKKLVTYMRNAGESAVRHSDMLRNTHLDAMEFKSAITLLRESEQIEEIRLREGKRGSERLYYRLTSKAK